MYSMALAELVLIALYAAFDILTGEYLLKELREAQRPNYFAME